MPPRNAKQQASKKKDAAKKTSSSSSNQPRCTALIPHADGFHAFLAKHLPMYLPPPLPPIYSEIYIPEMPSDIDLCTLKLDPRKCKEHDLYLLLNLQHRRCKATDAEIKAAYRAQSLRYHPDKLQQKSTTTTTSSASKTSFDSDDSDSEDDGMYLKPDAIFKCVLYAFETLSNAQRRELYDNVDPGAVNLHIPTAEEVPDIDSFLSVFGPIFASNDRWRKSKNQSSPHIGTAHSERKQVEAFYHYWNNFESLRRFDHLDEEDSADAENRDHKRYIQARNKAARLKRKNDDNARIRRLFEAAYSLDPRMIVFREQDRIAKEQAKARRVQSASSSSLKSSSSSVKSTAPSSAASNKTDDAVKQKIIEAKRAKAVAEKKRQSDRSAFKEALVSKMFFVDDLKNVALINERSQLVERLLLRLNDYEEHLSELMSRLDCNETDEIFDWIELQCEQLAPIGSPISSVASSSATSNANSPVESSNSINSSAPWTVEDLDSLIKGVKQFPGGTLNRWKTITEWHNRHASTIRSVEEVIARASALKKSASALSEDAAASAMAHEAGLQESKLQQSDYRAMQKRDPRVDTAAIDGPTLSVDHSLNLNDTAQVGQDNNSMSEWSVEEQKRLEEGLRSVPADVDDRWDRIAAIVASKSRKDCMLRVRDIAQQLKQQSSR